ncbi:MAG: hypothetical protein HY518_01120 [Candidatus Aenigmarchaeota archaeon]|nr:hypothetical protein [Candidatus Aenigmarchaeota archaeon]
MGKAMKIFLGLGVLFTLFGSMISFALIDDAFSSNAHALQEQIAVLELKRKQLEAQKSALLAIQDALMSELATTQDRKKQEAAAQQLSLLQAQEAQRQQQILAQSQPPKQQTTSRPTKKQASQQPPNQQVTQQPIQQQATQQQAAQQQAATPAPSPIRMTRAS